VSDGVTVARQNEQLAAVGSPEHAKRTAALNQFCGVTASVVVPVPPEFKVSEPGAAVNVKLDGGKLIV
jgi:hypothetical protein